MQLVKGQVVQSRAGRDTGRRYMVAGLAEDGQVLLCDGGRRPLKTPKKKNPRHVNPGKTVLEPPQLQDDAALRAALAALGAADEGG